MRKTTRSSLLFVCALALAAGVCGNNAFAQDENQEKKVVVTTFGDYGASISQNPSQALIMPFPQGAIHSRLRIGNVKNAPFSGEIVSESTQTLADGNRIVNRTNTIVYRDGQGRTRQETSFKIRDANSGGDEEARRTGVHGTVVLNVVFRVDGAITSIRVLRGLPDGLTEKAIEAARKIRFQPAVRNGTPVSVRGNLEFTFNL